MPTFHRALVVGAAVLICCLAMGCKQKLNTKKGEKLMKEKLPEMLQGAVEVDSVKCPKSVEAKTGDEFTCTAKLADGTELRLDVVQKDDEGNIEWRPEPHINTVMVAKTLTEEAKKNGVADAVFDCGGPPIKKTEFPATLDCKATSGGETSVIQISYDADGMFTGTKEVPQ